MLDAVFSCRVVVINIDLERGEVAFCLVGSSPGRLLVFLLLFVSLVSIEAIVLRELWFLRSFGVGFSLQQLLEPLDLLFELLNAFGLLPNEFLNAIPLSFINLNDHDAENNRIGQLTDRSF